ncbi:MAG TPA: tetratricopeptide repeat protein [Gemmataceae bacterium]|nr:tetratricopeptide repeat protein [Gemmataceae bacterium]
MSTLAPMLMCLVTGCASLPGGGFTPPWKKTDTPKAEAPKDKITLTSGGMKREVIDSSSLQELEGAKRLFDNKKYAEAEPIFHRLSFVASDAHWWEIGPLARPETKTDVPESEGYQGRRVGPKNRARGLNPVTEEALFMEAECQRLQKNYRTAFDTYTKLLTEVPRSQFTQRTCQGLFEIADYWLEPTRKQMDDYQKQVKGERWFVMPTSWFNFSNDYPAMDTEGHAVLVLNTIRLHDIKGPLGEKALMYLGTIHFYRQDYKEADFYFTQLSKEYKDGPYAAKAVKQSVICKQLMTGGSVYDCRGVEESKKLLMQAQAAYPELARDEEWVRIQLTSINIQQADRDLKIAEFYRRTGHPGSAYFYYELVCRRYPNTTFAEKAAKGKSELKAKVERDQPAPTPEPTNRPELNRPDMFVPPPPQALPGFGMR